MNQGKHPEPRSCLAVCPVCGSNCKKPYHNESVRHECPNGHFSESKTAKSKKK